MDSRKVGWSVIITLLLTTPLLFAGWEAQNSGTTACLYSVHFPEGTELGYVVGANGTILKTTNGGGDWVPLTSGTNATLYSVFFLDNQTGFAVGAGGTALKTTDGGANWQAMNVGTTADLRAVQFVGNGSIGFIATAGPNLLKTTDGGGTWNLRSLPLPTANARSLFFPTEEIGFVVGLEGFLSRTLNSGDSFEFIISGTTKDLYDLAFPPQMPATGYIVGDQTILFTPDTGRTWLKMPDPPTVLYSINIPMDMATAYAVGAQGTILKNSGAPMWTPQSSGTTLSLYSVFFPGQNDTGYVVGDSGTILKTVDGGVVGLTEENKPLLSKNRLIRITSNPTQREIILHSNADISVTLLDPAGRAIGNFPVTRGTNHLPVFQPGVYILKGDSETAKVVVSK